MELVVAFFTQKSANVILYLPPVATLKTLNDNKHIRIKPRLIFKFGIIFVYFYRNIIYNDNIKNKRRENNETTKAIYIPQKKENTFRVL